MKFKMPHKFAAGVMLALALAAAAPAGQRDKTASLPAVEWLKSLDEAAAVADKYRRPILIHLSPPGKMSRNEDLSTFDNDEVKQLVKYFVPVRLDPDNAGELVGKFEVDDFPAVIITDAALKQYGSNIEGHADAAELIKALKAVLAQVKTVTPDKAAVLEALEKKAAGAFEKRDFSGAAKYLNRIIAIKPDSGFTAAAKKKLDEISALGKAALDDAKKLADAGNLPAATNAYKKVQREFKELPEEERAAAALSELSKIPPVSKPPQTASPETPPKTGDNGSDAPAPQMGENSSVTKPPAGTAPGGAANPADPEEEAAKIYERGKLYEDNGARNQAIAAYRELLRKHPQSKLAFETKKRLEKLEESAPKGAEQRLMPIDLWTVFLRIAL